ncbi:cystathionine beta-synthase [Tilletia horrida]|uniref:cystathionine beta-synthase n=1 Tax=Tilletia horrida TaxID=155126 RepID=A0AAN6GFU9_9BASI|nr:cystathionine beta-synthase [Tilletia horrida]
MFARNGVLPDALSAVGATPLIRLNRIPQEHNIKCNVLVKCEFFNAGGSVKDRIAKNMLEHAEAEGILIPGKSVVIEPTSGNTGVGLALACAVKGYRCIIVLPEKMSAEKVTTLKILGAEVIRTPTEAAWDDPRSNIMVARRLKDEIPNAVMLDQYNNPNNPLAHRITAEEIIADIAASSALPARIADGAAVALKQTGHAVAKVANSVANLGINGEGAAPLTPEGSPPSRATIISGAAPSELEGHLPTNNTMALPQKSVKLTSTVVDALVAGVGTGGTISGVAARLREADHNPKVHVVGVDPVGSLLAVPAALNEVPADWAGVYKIEGIGYDFDPKTLDKSLINEWVKTEDEESFACARDLIRKEGLLIGGSSGSALAGALKWLKGAGWEQFGSQEGKNVVLIMPDSLRNYITKPWLLEDSMEKKIEA